MKYFRHEIFAIYGILYVYHIAGKFDGELNLVVW